MFSVIAEVKNQSHPQFGLGSRPEGFTINGIQGMELTLIRGITYSFAVMAPTHAFFISTSSIGGPLNLASEVTDGVVNSMISSGTLFLHQMLIIRLFFITNAVHTILWVGRSIL